MGQADVARVDVPVLLDVARQYQVIADIVDQAVRTHLNSLTFDGAAAGRAYTAHGDAVRECLDRVAEQLRLWSRASSEIAAALRASAERYADADMRGGERLG
ncbi:ESX-1 secretion-associated protein [Mycobacterium deserti]|uniref:ESX-1 secretion-associated protein n=1 Tax=Mycobacterium deserti TaxID=2978347 RepID=A0ABT2M765_9MYCO|nr:ESX-1 secretion-associated protein [Mycobacterium deserti]MCT7658108.1 ESX-1 secretion-associated protein [Mycobacterium deserti]